VRKGGWLGGRRWPLSNHDEKLYGKNPTLRFWNPFGKYRSGNATLQIGLEMNIPTQSNSETLSGFFASDPDNENIYVMHNGRFSGQSRTMQERYLTWSQKVIKPVANTAGDVRYGIVVGQINANTAGSAIARFVENVVQFKDIIRDEKK